jgi:hypothetical protein
VRIVFLSFFYLHHISFMFIPLGVNQLCILLFFKFRGDLPKKLCITIFQL